LVTGGLNLIFVFNGEFCFGIGTASLYVTGRTSGFEVLISFLKPKSTVKSLTVVMSNVTEVAKNVVI
jgi:hypothetical protein